MAKKDVGFFDQHVEKVVVGVAAACAIGVAAWSLGGGRFAVEGHGPGQLAQNVVETVDQTRQSILNAKPSEAKDTKTVSTADGPAEKLKDWFGTTAKGLTEVARLEAQPFRAQPFPPSLPFSRAAMKAEQHNLVKLVAPSVPIISSGRSTLFFAESKPLLGSGQSLEEPMYNSTGTAMTWVSVATQIALTEQEAYFISERYPPQSYLTIARVHLQRKDVDDPSRGWEDVNTYLPYEPLPLPLYPNGRINLAEMQKWRKNLDFDNEIVCRPPLPPKLAGEKTERPAVPYLDEPPRNLSEYQPGLGQQPDPPEVIISRRVKKWTDLARAALNGKKPFKQMDVDAALVLARAAVATTGAKEKEAETAKQVFDEVVSKLPKTKKTWATAPMRVPERVMPIMAHDLTALPGHTYVYRMRYEVLNIFAGNPDALLNPADADLLTIVSDWSPESRPVEIQSDLYFYFTKAEKDNGRAIITVLRKTARGINKQDYAVRPGEKIGRKEPLGTKIDYSTGMMCVDVDFDRVIDGKKEIALVYSDSSGSALYERILSKDVADKSYKKLLDFKPPKP